jgi:hypothetical protein
MGPKKKPTDNPEEEDNTSMLEMMRGMAAQLSAMNAKMDKIDTIESEVRDLKVLLNDLKNENKQLKFEAKTMEKQLTDMNEKNNTLENRLNSLEQHHRGWSARVLNIPLTAEEESDNYVVANKVYNLALLPILRGAVERKLLKELPSAEQLLEIAHVLPGRAGEPKPVIMRFYNRNVRDTIFKLKKFYSPRESSGGAAGGRTGASRGGAAGGGASARASSGSADEAGGFEGRGKYIFPIYEDLTRASFQKMRAIAKDSRVHACWSTKGQIKFILHSKPNEIMKVQSLLDPLDKILK